MDAAGLVIRQAFPGPAKGSLQKVLLVTGIDSDPESDPERGPGPLRRDK
jgi:hypothetical protein